MLIYLLTALAAATTSAPSSQPATVPVAAVWHDIGYPPPGVMEFQRLHVGVWSDGTVIWTTGPKEPYQRAKVEPARVEKLLKELDELRFFDDPEVNRQPYAIPPDASHTIVAAEFKRQRLASWKDPPDSDRPRFNEVFVKAEAAIRALVPEKGEPVEKIDKSIFRLGRQPRGS